MSLTFAVDELYGTGWEADGCASYERAADGRLYPTAGEVAEVFERVGAGFRMQMDEGLGVFLAEWGDGEGVEAGRVVGSSRDEAAVYALARLLGRRGVVAG